MVLKPSLAPVLPYACHSRCPHSDSRQMPVAVRYEGRSGHCSCGFKTRLAATRWTVLRRLEVEAAEDGTVWLSGTTPTEEAAERAVDIARNAGWG